MLNLMPYMQDGKLKWTTAEVGAQLYYTEAIIVPGFVWQCGENAHKYKSSYYFYSDEECETLTTKPSLVLSCDSKAIDIYCSNSPSALTYLRENWCVFLILQALTGADICNIAQDYYLKVESILNATCALDNPVDLSKLSTFFSLYGISTERKSGDAETIICS